MRSFSAIAVVVAVLMSCLTTAHAGVKYENEDGDYVKLGGRIQLQYHRMDPDGGASTDELIFRRFRPYIEGSVHEDFKGKFQWDMGKGSVSIKDAYFKYSGYDSFNISVGNMNFPFSREVLTSSKKQQLIERTFVGDHNYGTPERQAGVHFDGTCMDKKLAWAASVCKGGVDPSNSKLDFDTIIQIDAGDDWSEGEMIGARVDYHPFGPLKFAQGDFKGDTMATISIAGFFWGNDDDNLDASRSNDVDQVTGIEVSGAYRGGGFSVDAEYNIFESELMNNAITAGLYENGETTLENIALEGGYMVLPEQLEIVAGYQTQDADNYAKSWNRTSVGLNYFFEKHDVKLQFTYRMNENKDGKDGNDLDELFAQAQYVF